MKGKPAGTGSGMAVQIYFDFIQKLDLND